jgi:WhiB family redox-sensing transcriptional regulator
MQAVSAQQVARAVPVTPAPSGRAAVELGTVGQLTDPIGADTRVADDWNGLEVFGLEEPEGELAWQERALCAQTDPESFFPEKGGSTREAKRVCTTCEVRTECLEYALAHDERFGIWGGLSERERRRVRRAAV